MVGRWKKYSLATAALQEASIKYPVFTDPQFVDASGVGGLNAAVGTVSGSIGSVGLGVWATPGLLAPESMTYAGSGLTANVTLPPPFGIVTSGGVVVRAHGVLTNADTQAYAVSFSGLVPGAGSITAYLAATINQIQQNPFLITGPPPGHPNYNPNFVPITAYANQVYSLTLAAVSGGIDNVTTFEVFRTTLTAGQSSLGVISTAYQKRAATALAKAPLTVSGGTLTVPNVYSALSPATSGLTSTLPPASGATGLVASFTNGQPGTYTIAASDPVGILGYLQSASGVVNIPMPTGATVELYSTGTAWYLKNITPAIMTQLNNSWTGTNAFYDNNTGSAPVTVIGTGTRGANIQLVGNGATTPSKWIRAINGVLQIVNDAYSAVIATIDNVGNATFSGTVIGNAISSLGNLLGAYLGISGNAVIGGTVTAYSVFASSTIQSTAGAVYGVIVESTSGNITSAARLRAVNGAYGTGDQNCATLLADFPFTGNYFILPSGLIVQYGTASSPNNTLHNFPISFPTSVFALVCQESSPSSGSWGGNKPTVHACLVVNNGQFTHWTLTWNGSGWFNPGGAGNSFAYIAIGY